MCRKFILLTSFVLAMGAGVSYAADPFLQSSGPDGIVAMEAEHFHTKVAASNRSWELVGPKGGFTGAAGMQALPDGGTNINTGYVTTSPHLDFEVAFQKTGTYSVWVRAWGPDGSGDSVHAGLDGQAIATCDRMQGWTSVYAWSKATMDTAPSTFDVTTAGVHVVNIYMREDGLIVDKIVLTTNANYTPTGDGPPENPLKASSPIPANGAIEVTDSVLQWTAGETAVSHKVYLSADATIDASDFLIETPLTLAAPDLLPGATYYWRVDEVQADKTEIQGDVWTFTMMPLEAHSPKPADGATGVALDAKLSWTAGRGTILNDLYFGTDQAAVAAKAPTTFKGKLNVTSFDPGPLQPFTTYYWKVDEFAGIKTNAGPVWSFSTVQYLIIDEAEKTLNYDNTIAPFYSELVWDTPQDLTYGGVADLTLRFQGRPGPEGNLSIDEATGTYTLTGSGADIWGTSDQFHYGYVKLSGDGEISARVVSNGTGSNLWAKGGVMIRETTAADSKHMIMALTGGDGSGIAFQGRHQATGAASSSMNGDITAAPPYWVKLTRAGNTITAYCSADGVNWTLFPDTSPDNAGGAISNPMTVEMADPVLVGLFVTSHAAGEKRTYTFDNVSVKGNIVADIEHQDVGIASNSAEPLFVTLEDSAGVSAVVAYPDPAATRITQWWKWKIPLSAFSNAGVNLTAAAKLHIGVGDRLNPTPGGSGLVRIDDILVVKPVIITEPADVTAPGDNIKGVPNDGVNTGGDTFGWPSAETPPLAIDNKTSTKYLHFKGEKEPTGFQVTPSAIQSVVTGLTFTTANDSPERDPIAFELYGSNVSIDGPYELIAAGPIVDFNQPTAAARFTKNTTPIMFDNAVAYDHYQILFPTVRSAATANSMQIAEVELIGTAGAAAPKPQVIWVSFHGADDAPSNGAKGVGFTEAPDKPYTDLLKANGYEVTRYISTATPDPAVLNAADLVIISRSVASSGYQNAGATAWNNIAAPMIIVNGYTIRKSRMGFATGNTIPDITGDIKLTVNNSTHPIFAGIPLTGGTMVNPYAGLATYPTDATKAAGISVITDAPIAGGMVLATLSEASGTVTAGSMVIAEWPAGATVTHDGGAGTDVLAGPRLVFLTGSRENGGKSSETAGMYDLYPDGEQMFLNAVKYMVK